MAIDDSFKDECGQLLLRGERLHQLCVRKKSRQSFLHHENEWEFDCCHKWLRYLQSHFSTDNIFVGTPSVQLGYDKQPLDLDDKLPYDPKVSFRHLGCIPAGCTKHQRVRKRRPKNCCWVSKRWVVHRCIECPRGRNMHSRNIYWGYEISVLKQKNVLC